MLKMLKIEQGLSICRSVAQRLIWCMDEHLELMTKTSQSLTTTLPQNKIDVSITLRGPSSERSI